MGLAALSGALWLGILTAVSPCPLAANAAALSFLARGMNEPRRVLWGGAAYTLGRVVSYVLLAALLVSGLLSIPSLSFFLQKNLNLLMGPVLVLVGGILLGFIPFPSFTLGGGAWMERLAASGIGGSFALGFFLALAFCPVSAALFFGTLLPLAVQNGSRVTLPALYGLGTALPVAVLALAVAVGVRKGAEAFNRMATAERWMKRWTGWFFIGLGTYRTVTDLIWV